MWFGILAAVLLCLATAIAYAELSKLYPGAGSSYFFAEQAFLSKAGSQKFARIAKFTVGWASHLYYWGYPGPDGRRDGAARRLRARPDLARHLQRRRAEPAVHDPASAVVFSFGVAYIAYRGVSGSTAVAAAINVIQITRAARVLGDGDRLPHRTTRKARAAGRSIRTAIRSTSTLQVDAKGAPIKDAKGDFVVAKNADGTDKPFTVSYAPDLAMSTAPDPADPKQTVTSFQFHTDAKSVVAPHNFSYMIIQACIAILILVGFESVTSMGEEAKNAKRDIPRAVILSLLIQGVFCYLIEYFAANYFLQQRLPDLERARIGGTARRHDDHRRHLDVRQPGGRQGVHARAGAHRVPRAHRHDARRA